MFKKILSFTLILALGMFTFPAFAADPISVYLDGRALTFDVSSQLINGNAVTIDQPWAIIDGRTLAPLRFVAEAFGGDVQWDGNMQTASITMGGAAPATPPTTPTPTPTQLPSGNTNHTGFWWRAGLPGFGFILLNFDSSGEFTQEIRFNSAGGATHWEQVYKGNYSISGDKMTFTYKVAEHRDAGKEWGTIALPGNKTLTFTYVEDNGTYGDYIDFTNGGLPPFDEPVTRMEEQGGNEDLVVTRFSPASTNSSALNR